MKSERNPKLKVRSPQLRNCIMAMEFRQRNYESGIPLPAFPCPTVLVSAFGFPFSVCADFGFGTHPHQ